MSMSKTRNASFELLRIICMFMIVLYHIFVKAHSCVWDSPTYSTLLFPLHIAVVCFLLISGYFGIKFSFRRLTVLFVQILFYNILCYVVCSLLAKSFNIKDLLISFLPLSHNQDLWFIRTYIMLLIVSPILNKYIEFAPPYSFKIMCVLMAFISVYLGIKSDDVSLNGGKNLVNFIFIYFLGHAIKMKYFIPNLSLKIWIMAYLAFNILECATYYLSFGHGLACKISVYGWAYNSPLLILNAILFFMVFNKLKIESSFISSLARSVFPIYLIHSNLNVQNVLWPIVKDWSSVNLLASYLAASFIIMLLCILIDQILAPIYHRIGDRIINVMNLK